MVARNSSLEEIKTIVKDCLNQVYQQDSDLFERNDKKGVCERCLVFRFAHYLQNKITNFSVDCDFNSSYRATYINGRWVCEPRQGKPIEEPNGTITNRFVDIIIHKRSDFINNENIESDFLCFEIKKWNYHNKNQIEKDKNNLRVLTSRFGYKFGFYINLHRNKNKTKWTIYKNGNEIRDDNAVIVFNNETTH